jgi:4-amino-4-deoxy-L-arabinose transferase-like glycosyltransferase
VNPNCDSVFWPGGFGFLVCFFLLVRGLFTLRFVIGLDGESAVVSLFEGFGCVLGGSSFPKNMYRYALLPFMLLITICLAN